LGGEPAHAPRFIHSSEGVREAKDGFLRTANPEIAVPLADVLPR